MFYSFSWIYISITPHHISIEDVILIMSGLFDNTPSSSTTHLVNFTSYPSISRSKSNARALDNDHVSLSSGNVSYSNDFFVTDNENEIDQSSSELLISNLLHIYKPQSKKISKPSLQNNLSRFALLNNTKRGNNANNDTDSSSTLKFSLGLSKKNSSNSNRTTGIGRDYWLDDVSASKCKACDRKFSTFLRKHHCRICGKIFCSSCTTFIDGKKFNYNGKMRVCLLCNDLADKYDDDYFSSEDEEDDLEMNSTRKYDIGEDEINNLTIQDELPKDNMSVDDFKTNSSMLKSDRNYSQITSYSPPMMAIPTTRVGETVEIDTFKKINPKKSSITPSTLNYDNFDNQADSSEDENEIISLMNKHQFSWPKSANSQNSKFSQNISINTNNSYSTKSTGNFLAPMKSTSNSAINPIIYNLKSNRRRVFSNRNKNRKTLSRNFSTSINTKGSSNFDVDSTIQFSDDFQRIGENYAKGLLNELLIDRNISNYQEWTTILMQSLKKFSNSEVYLKNVDNSSDPNPNFSNFFKVKKIVGSSLENTKVIEGIVFSKKLPMKTMASTIENPKIMLITFPIEYDQDIDNRHHFQSLESIIAQQDQYIKKLVDRIVNLKPTIILSSNSINGIALKLFADLGISVAPDCKLNNLIKLSKFTDSTIITSIDVLAMKPRLGTCSIFKALNFKFENTVKTYFLFDGCLNKIGLTILLRDKSDDVLSKVKGCLLIMVYTFINIKLESSFLRDKCLKVDDNNVVKSINPENLTPLYSYNYKSYHDFGKLMDERLVSTSPWVKFEKPLILKQIEDTCLKVEENNALFNSFGAASNDEKLNMKPLFHIENFNIVDNDDLIKLVKAIYKYKDKSLKVESEVYTKKWDQFWRSRELSYFDPYYNQRIVVLFSLISKSNSTPCIGPDVQIMDFYWGNSFSLGQFIETVCLTANNLCDHACQLPLKDHYRSYVHDHGKIDIFIETNDSNVTSSNIMNWSVCKNCLNSTPVLPLNDVSYKYSFEKFLELIFWFNNSYDFKILNNNNNCQCNVNNPKFDFFKNYIHYFGYKNFEIRIEYSRIDNLKLIVPRFQLLWNPVYDYKIKLDYFNDIKMKSNKFFGSVSNRLARIKLNGTNLDSEDIEKANALLVELNYKLDAQRRDIDLLLTTVYKNSELNEHLRLNTVVREVQELSSFWNQEFQSFAKAFLPSEKDVKTITAFQLDRLFKSLAGKDEDEGENEGDGSEVTEDNKQSIHPKEDGDDHGEKLDDQNNPTNSEITKHKSQLILNKIDELKNKQSGDFIWIPPNKSIGESLDEGKVKQLTKFFDTQEYFDQRELEKQQLNNFSKYTPKVSSMKPRIEIYNSASDAVNSASYKNNKLNSNPSSTANLQSLQAPNEDTKKEKVREQEREPDKDKDKDKDVQHEKISLLKSLTNFWADRSATLWEPLSYPLGASEHIFVDSDIIVREDEPSSIIAFCLSTNDYQSKLKAFDSNENIIDENNNGENLNNKEKENIGTEDNSKNNEKETKSDIEIDQELENTMLKKGFHLQYQLEEGYSNILCKIFFTQQFDALREKCGVNGNYIESLARCVKWDSTGGKSGSTFLKTLDQRFIIKELSKAELEAFVHFAPAYFEYFSQVLFHDLPSVLVKIFGFYQIQVKSTLPNAKSYSIDILIMENLFYDRRIDRIFDLKGSMRNRHVEQTGKENEVLLDENMVEYIYESPLFIKQNDKKFLKSSLWNDTLFLEKMNVMDYSLVVGIDNSKDELVVGIIDCIRTFTWDKKLESWVKEKGLVGNSGVGREPTVITPKQYKNRFREAMGRYILMAPGVYFTPESNNM